MEHTNPPVSKRIRNIMRVIFFMFRNGISKKKITFDFNTTMKRNKHSIQESTSHRNQRAIATSAPQEYEFSCSNTPFHISRKSYSHFFACAQPKATEEDDLVAANAVKIALEMFHSVRSSPAPVESPWLSGFGRSPAVKRVRVTDSPFPIEEFGGDTHVDEAAGEFIMKFYRDLRKQNVLALQC